ncbi:hypothetical protein D3C77_490920 [compost metagenome]
MLANIQCCRMETKQFYLTDHLLNMCISNVICIMVTQAAVDNFQIFNELPNVRITLRSPLLGIIQQVMQLLRHISKFYPIRLLLVEPLRRLVQSNL